MLAALTRARETAPIPAPSPPTDLHRPARGAAAAGRLNISFRGIVVAASALGRWNSGDRADADVGFALVGAAAMVPAPQRATGSSATIANSAAPTVVALFLARSALRAPLGKISRICQR